MLSSVLCLRVLQYLGALRRLRQAHQAAPPRLPTTAAPLPPLDPRVNASFHKLDCLEGWWCTCSRNNCDPIGMLHTVCVHASSSIGPIRAFNPICFSSCHADGSMAPSGRWVYLKRSPSTHTFGVLQVSRQLSRGQASHSVRLEAAAELARHSEDCETSVTRATSHKAAMSYAVSRQGWNWQA